MNTNMQQLNLVVLDAEIENGDRSSCKSCPMALALNRHLLPAYGALVKHEWALIVNADATGDVGRAEYAESVDLPASARTFIVIFDNAAHDSGFALRSEHSFQIPAAVYAKCFYQIT